MGLEGVAPRKCGECFRERLGNLLATSGKGRGLKGVALGKGASGRSVLGKCATVLKIS